MKKGKIYIGTSGWSYKHWKGKFYPIDLPDSMELPYYVKYFKTVEINNSFYHLPTAKTFTHWREETPSNFIFSVKTNRYITHIKKLKTDNDGLKNFLKNASRLKGKLGPILIQLPPGWNLNLERLETFLSKLPKKHRYTFEFRNHSWFDDRVYELLRKYNCALCIYDLQGFSSPMEITSNFVYIRFHGPKSKYSGSYTRAFLKKWAKQFLKWQQEGKDVYVYLNHDEEGYAVSNGLLLAELVKNKKSFK